MRIGIDARSIEVSRRGAGRILYNLLKEWSGQADGLRANIEFVLYFKNHVPEDGFLRSPRFTLKVLPPILGHESNALFEHVLLPRALKQDKIDVLYAPYYSAPAFCPCPYVVVMHDVSFEVHPEWVPGVDKILRRYTSKWSAKHAAHIIAVSDFSRREVIKHYRISPDKVSRIYQTGTDDKLLSETGINLPGKPYTLFVGTFINRRHLPELIRAVEEINKTEPFYLALVGEDRTHPAQNIALLIKQANDKLGGEFIRQYQEISDEALSTLYKNANSVSLLSEYEGFGLPLLEGMALGVPVVIAPNSSLEEVAAGAALVSDPRNPHTIARDLTALMHDENLRQQLIAKGRARAQDFNFAKAAAETLDLIIKTANEKPS